MGGSGHGMGLLRAGGYRTVGASSALGMRVPGHVDSDATWMGYRSSCLSILARVQ